jgi:uncharacterized phage protein (TIGR02216 family)
MAFGFGILRLSSAQFWALTPLELAAAHRGMTGHAAPIAPDLFALMQRFPDEGMIP